MDAFIFFDDNDEVEKTFRTALASLSLVTFESNPTHFLGNKLTTSKDWATPQVTSHKKPSSTTYYKKTTYMRLQIPSGHHTDPGFLLIR